MNAMGDTRPLNVIAQEITKSWPNPSYSAEPYLAAMRSLGKVTDNYGADSGESIVVYFLANASGWRGETARRVKAELKAMVK